MLQIRVHEDDRVALGVVEPRHHRGLLAEIARKAYIADRRVALRKRTNDVKRLVAAPVVDEEE